MAKVILSDQTVKQLGELSNPILARVQAVLERLEKWPAVSGAKPLRGTLKGHFRIRTGDWRIVIWPAGADVGVARIDNRKDVYED
jgi:mRNA-degrading endonuclease RelE of RelBE toxin-antitoxin system